MPQRGPRPHPRPLTPARLLFCAVGLCCAASFFLFSPARILSDSTDDLQSVADNDALPPTLVLLVPFRDRFDELLRFVPHMTSFLRRQRLRFSIHVLNQVDGLRFNRASLINAGFALVGRHADYIAMHDVDLLPLDADLSYRFPGHGTPFHVSSPDLHPKYRYPAFVGGILLITSQDFALLDGMSNKYWGWGLEDDEFYVRMREKKMNISRPTGIKSGRSGSFLHLHKESHRRDTAKLFNQREVNKRRDRETGLHSLQFKQVAQHELLINGSACTVHDIELSCDRQLTPWCHPKERVSSEA